jgi:hypothetical protein
MDNSARAFDKIVLQAYVPGPYFVVQFVKLFFIECKLGNILFPSKQIAALFLFVIVAIVVLAIVVIVVIVTVVVIVIAFNVGNKSIHHHFQF